MTKYTLGRGAGALEREATVCNEICMGRYGLGAPCAGARGTTVGMVDAPECRRKLGNLFDRQSGVTDQMCYAWKQACTLIHGFF